LPGFFSRLAAFLARPFRRGRGIAALTAATTAAIVCTEAAVGAASCMARAVEATLPPAALAAAPGAQQQARRELAAAFAAFSEPSARNLLDWTPATIRAAEQQAESGDLSYAGQLCEWLLGDERVQTCASTRVQALIGAPMSFEKGTGRKARAAAKAVEAEEDWWQLLPEAEQARILEWGLLLGVAVVHRDHTMRPAPGEREVPVCRAWSPRWLRLREGRWYVRVAAAGGGYAEVEASKDNGFLLFFPYGESRPWSRGLWRGLSRLALMKSYAIVDWCRHSEVHGNPAWLAVPKDQASYSQHREDLSSDLSQLGRESVIVVPPGYDVKLAEAVAKTWEMFVAQMKVANDSIAIAWLGGNLVTDTGDGSATGATAQTLVRHDKRRYDAQVFTTWAHDNVLADWAVWNFGSTDVAPWPVYDVDPPADVEAEARALGTLGEALTKVDAGLRPHRLQVDAQAICDTYAVPTMPLLEAAPAQQQPPAPPPANDGGQGLAAVIPIEAAREARARRVPWAPRRRAAR